jgi:uncharacterized protein (TIGR02145 family)
MKKKQLKNRIITVSVILFWGAMNISAQVTIGKLAEPHKAAILDLSQSQNLGLLLPHVRLTGLTPFQLLPAPADPQKEADATGMVVYNDEHVNDDVYPGIYVWDGKKWGRIDDGTSPPLLPFSVTTSGDAYCNGVLFSIPDNYSDWDNATNFVWTLTSPSPEEYTPVTVTSGSKNSHFFVPYDNMNRTYEVSVYAEGSKLRSLVTTESQSGQMLGTSNFFIDGSNCYDIAKTDYEYNKEDASQYETRYGVLAYRTELQPETDYSYTVKGTGTVTSYSWSVSDPDGILSSSPDGSQSASVNIQFKPEVLLDAWLIDYPTNERIVVLTCLVTDDDCEYVVSKEIKVGDRDCCTGLRDIEGIIYSAVRFGDAGCWMTENLAVTKNQKLGNEVNLEEGNTGGEYNPRYTQPKITNGSQLSSEDAKNSNYFSSFGTDIGKPGLLYNWAAAVGAKSAADAQSTDIYPPKNDTSPANAASRDASKDEDICPVGWYLPSDAEWSELEQEISAHPSNYSTETVSTTWGEEVGDRGGDSTPSHSNGHGAAMRNDMNIGNISNYKDGLSKSKESGFNGLLVGYAGHGTNTVWSSYGNGTNYWSSSSSCSSSNPPENNYAWKRGLSGWGTQVSRSYFNPKYNLYSVRCKKLD